MLGLGLRRLVIQAFRLLGFWHLRGWGPEIDDVHQGFW